MSQYSRINLEPKNIIEITSIDSADSPYVVLYADHYISCDVSSGVISVKLPDSPKTGHIFIIKDAAGNSSVNNITVTTVSGTVDIDGATSQIISMDYKSLNFIFNETSYEIF